MENKDLTITTNEGKEIFVIDSREVAEMMGKTHAEIIQYLEGLKDKNGKTKVVGIIPTLEQVGDLQVANYFIESSYNDRGRERKCYLITKMGCELLGNKQQGEKGILFTAKYVERFNEYEKRFQELSMPSYAIEDPIKRAERWIEEYKEKVKLEHTIKEITTHALTIEDSRLVINRLVRKIATEVYHGKFQNCWDALYNKFNYLEGINIKKRKRAKGQSMLDTLNEEETYSLEVVVKNWCVEHNIDIEEQLKLK